jgi:hypothetical protein
MNSEKPTTPDEPTEDYFLDYYGTCNLDNCKCVKLECWPGRMCPDWRPLGVKSNFELLEYLRKERNYGSSRDV